MRKLIDQCSLKAFGPQRRRMDRVLAGNNSPRITKKKTEKANEGAFHFQDLRGTAPRTNIAGGGRCWSACRRFRESNKIEQTPQPNK